MPNWTRAEIDYLLELAGDIPRNRLQIAFNSWAVANGYPKRSAKAIWVQAARNGISLRAVGSFLTTGGIAQILGINATTIEGWLHRYPDLPRTKIKNWYYINRRDLRRWARSNMQRFGGIPHANLVQLFEDERLADAIQEAFPTKPQGLEGTAKRVICIESGITYPSLSAAARATHISYQAISLSITEKRPSCGLNWKFV
jgi:hypothetical protein